MSDRVVIPTLDMNISVHDADFLRIEAGIRSYPGLVALEIEVQRPEPVVVRFSLIDIENDQARTVEFYRDDKGTQPPEGLEPWLALLTKGEGRIIEAGYLRLTIDVIEDPVLHEDGRLKWATFRLNCIGTYQYPDEEQS